MDKISIIVPVFNGEQYLRECLNSIKNQIFKNFEVVLIDDCSTDSTPTILKAFVESDSRFLCLRNESNRGLSYSRNIGIQYSTGQYIFFVDADDMLDELCLQTLIDALVKYNGDIAICSYKMFESLPVSNTLCTEINIFNRFELMKELALCFKIQNFAWGKLYKKELFNGILFPVGRYYEDICTTPLVFDKVNTAVFVESELYCYRQNIYSISKTLNKKKINDFFKSMEEKAFFISKNYPDIFKYMSQSFFELFYLLKEKKIKNNIIDNYSSLKKMYKKAVSQASLKQKIKYLLATL